MKVSALGELLRMSSSVQTPRISDLGIPFIMSAESCPATLYKYKAWNSYTERLLRYKELYYSTIDQLNDLGEYAVQLDTRIDLEQARAVIDRLVAHHSTSPDDEESARFIQDSEGMKEGDYLPNLLGDAFVRTAHKLLGLRVCCFTTDPTSRLMWAHYADQHKGICLGFSSASSDLSKCQRVNYASQVPVAQLTELAEMPFTARSASIQRLYTKHEDWSYEREWRLFSESHTEHLPEDALTEVVFGHRMAKKDRIRAVRAIRKAKWSGVKFFDIHASAYSLTLVPSRFALDDLN